VLLGAPLGRIDEGPVPQMDAIMVAGSHDGGGFDHPSPPYSALLRSSNRMRPTSTLVTPAFWCCMVENMGKSKGRANPVEDAPFEQVMERLQSVVEQLEQGDLPLEESLAMFEEGVRLSRAGAKRLDEAERRVEELLAAGDELQTSPLDESEAGEQ